MNAVHTVVTGTCAALVAMLIIGLFTIPVALFAGIALTTASTAVMCASGAMAAAALGCGLFAAGTAALEITGF